MLQNEYLVAKIGVDPAENEPSKEGFVLEVLLGAPKNTLVPVLGRARPLPNARAPAVHLSRFLQIFTDFYRFCRFLEGSFSAGSTPIFATKYSFLSIFDFSRFTKLSG